MGAGGWFRGNRRSLSSVLLTGRHRREQAKLAHHPDIVPVSKMLGNLVIEHPVHVHVLNLERAPCGLHTDQHPAIDRKVRRAPVRAAVSASDNDPLALRDRVQNRQPRIGEVGLYLRQHLPNASTPDLPTVVPAVLGEAACRLVEVAAIERFMELFSYAPVGLRDVQNLLFALPPGQCLWAQIRPLMAEAHRPRPRDGDSHQHKAEQCHVLHEIDHLRHLGLRLLNRPEIVNGEGNAQKKNYQ